MRAFVGVRSQQGNTRLSSQLLPMQNIPAELDPLGLNFDMSPTGIIKKYIFFFHCTYFIFVLHIFLGGNESPKWSGLNSDLGSSSSPQPQGIPKVC